MSEAKKTTTKTATKGPWRPLGDGTYVMEARKGTREVYTLMRTPEGPLALPGRFSFPSADAEE